MVTRAGFVPQPMTSEIPFAFRLPFVVRNMVRRWRKTVSATIGVGVALSIVVPLLGIAAGVLDIVVGEYEKSTADLYIVNGGGTIAPALPGDSPGSISDARALLNQISGLPGVASVVGTISRPLARDRGRDETGKKLTEPWDVTGVWGDPTRVAGMLDMREGRWLRNPNDVVLPARLADGKGIHLGDTVTLNEKRFQVVGIGSMRGIGYASLGTAFLSYQTLSEMSRFGDRIAMIIVDTALTQQTAERIDQVRDLDIYTAKDVAQEMLDLATHDIVTAYLFSFLGLCIAALFVGNMLVMTVNERRIEIATLRAIGVPRRLIFGLIIGESFAIILVAYVLGAVLGTGLAEMMNAVYAPMVNIGRLISVGPDLYLQVFGVSIALAIIASVIPARAAMRIQPADALREA